MFKIRHLTALAALIPLFGATIASATPITGETLRVQRESIFDIGFGPTSSFSATVDVVVGPGVEINALTAHNDLAGFDAQIDIGPNTITLTRLGVGPMTISGGAQIFSGFHFSDLFGTIDPFMSISLVSVQGITGLTTDDLSFTDDVLTLDVAGTVWTGLNVNQTIPDGGLGSITFAFTVGDDDTTTTVPEPLPLALFALGLGGLLTRRLRTRQ